MADIKGRLSLADKLCRGHEWTVPESFQGEAISLLIRKSLEQIAFATLVANREAYDAVHADGDSTWRATKLLQRIKIIHPAYFPKPLLRPSTWKSPPTIENRESDYLTEDEFNFLYDACSEVLHTWNPFRKGPRQVNFERPVADWIQRIAALLDFHMVRLAGREDVWLVDMRAPHDGKVHAYLAEALTSTPSQETPSN